jgi:hypothetical protein
MLGLSQAIRFFCRLRAMKLQPEFLFTQSLESTMQYKVKFDKPWSLGGENFKPCQNLFGFPLFSWWKYH